MAYISVRMLLKPQGQERFRSMLSISQRTISLLAMICWLLLLSACNRHDPANLSATSELTRSTPATCYPDQVLAETHRLLAGSEYEVHYLTINGQLTLSIWLVDPEIDLAVEQENLAENTHIAFLRGVTLAHQLTQEIPCTRQLFININPMIVDQSYNSWYVDIIPIWVLSEVSEPTDEELMAAVERSGMEIAYLRHDLPIQFTLQSPDNTCTWAEARATIAEFLGDGHRNTAAYLISGYQAGLGEANFLPQVFAQISWDVTSPEEQSREVILEHIKYLAQSVACVSPPLNRLETYIVDADGQLLIYGQVSGQAIRENPDFLPDDQVRLHYLQGE